MAIQEAVRGLYRDRRLLVIDYEHNPVFPNRCIFTNKPVTGRTRLKIRIMPAKVWSPRTWLELDLPISNEWKGARDATTEFWGRLAWRVGLWAWIPAAFMFALGTLLDWLHPARDMTMPTGGYLIIAGGFLAGIAIVGTIIGAAWPYIEVPTSSTEFIGTDLSPPHVWIPGVHPEFLEQLPKFEYPKRSMLRVLLGR